MPSATSSAHSAHSGGTGTTARSHNAYHGPVEDHDGDYDVDSSVYCTDLMASAYDDPVTGWREGGGEGGGKVAGGGGSGGTPRNAPASGGGTNGTNNKTTGGGLIKGLLKKGKRNNRHGKKASGAAAIALAYNDFGDSDDDDNDDEEEEEQDGNKNTMEQGDAAEGESDLLGGGGGGRSTLQSILEDNVDDDDDGTVQTKTDVFLRYADSTLLEDGLSTVAPDEEADGGNGGNGGNGADADADADANTTAEDDGLHKVVEEDNLTTKSSSNAGGNSDAERISVVSGSIISSLASGGVSKYGGAGGGGSTPPRTSGHKHIIGGRCQPRQYMYGRGRSGPGSSMPDWARDDDDDDDDDDGSTEESSEDRGPAKPTKYRRSKSGGSESAATRKRNRMLTGVAMTMLFLGLCAVVLGVAYGMGLMGGGGGGGGGGKGKTSSSGANGSSQACARTGSCGGGADGAENGGGDDIETADPALTPLLDDTTSNTPIMTVPTDRPTSRPFDDTDGMCAKHGAKSQSCGAHNPNHPARCCSGLYCKDKVCTDPSPNDNDDKKKDNDDKNKKPTASPTSVETREPTMEPEPTSRPTSAAPTKPPTPNMWISQPTSEVVAEGVILPPGHFTYDPNDAVYGPQVWSNPRYASTTSVTLDGRAMTDTARLAEMGSDELDGLEIVPGSEASAEYKFWSRHAWSIDPNRKTAITENVCGGFDARAEQSPIDVYVQSGDIDETGEETGIPGSVVQPRCFEHHEIRIKSGQFSLDNDKIRKEILPSQLRLTYPDPEFEADGKTLAADSKLPTADFPQGWGGNMEALRVDVKIPSEHWLNGKEYVAEYQLYHLHHKKKRAPVITIMMDLHPLDKPNEHFQLALDQWQAVWQKDYLECELRERKERRATATLMESIKSWISPTRSKQEKLRQSTILDEPAEELEKIRRNLRAARKMQEETNFAWDPYKKDEIMRSIHFFAYSGSLTEPPCTEFVDWRILDTPMLISRRQLFQMKTLLFNHRSVESDCRPSSNHHMGSVARRPLQPLNKRKVYRCSCRDFLSDEDRDTILALDGMTEANATYTPRCSKREFRLAEKKRSWLHRLEEEGMTPVDGTLLPENPEDGGL